MLSADTDRDGLITIKQFIESIYKFQLQYTQQQFNFFLQTFRKSDKPEDKDTLSLQKLKNVIYMFYANIRDTAGAKNNSTKFHQAMVWPSQVEPNKKEMNFED